MVFTLDTKINRIQRILIFSPFGQSNEAKLGPILAMIAIVYNDHHYYRGRLTGLHRLHEKDKRLHDENNKNLLQVTTYYEQLDPLLNH